MFSPVQPITQFTQFEIYLLPFRFIGRLLSPIKNRHWSWETACLLVMDKPGKSSSQKWKLESEKQEEWEGLQNTEEVCCWLDIEKRENSNTIPDIQLVTCIGHREQLGKGDSHRITGQETYSQFRQSFVTLFCIRLSDIAWIDPLLFVAVSPIRIQAEFDRLFENTFLSQNFQSSSKWVYFCSISLLFSSTAALVMTSTSAITLNTADTESLFYRSHTETTWNLMLFMKPHTEDNSLLVSDQQRAGI